MAQLLLKGKPIHTAGTVPGVHKKAPPFKLIDKDLKERSLQEFQGKKKLITTVPSLDTGTCSTMTKRFNQWAQKHPEWVILVVSADLPFAQNRFCETEQVHNVVTLSTLRHQEFGKDYGILIQDGPIAGLLARAVFVLDEKDQIVYVEVVAEITQEPDYNKAMAAL